MQTNQGFFTLWIDSLNGESIKLNWVKLEIGEEVTPYSSPDRTLELMRCRTHRQNLWTQFLMFMSPDSRLCAVIPTPQSNCANHIKLTNLVIYNGNFTNHSIRYEGFKAVEFSGDEHVRDSTQDSVHLRIPVPDDFPFEPGVYYASAYVESTAPDNY